jgi:Skp family chaperone for outer membrane proteins
MMKKMITKSLLVVTMLVFTVTSAIAAKHEGIIDKSNVFQSSKKHAMNITGISGKDKKATTTTELQTVDSNTSAFDGDDVTMEQLRLIILLMCLPVSWQAIPMNIQLR